MAASVPAPGGNDQYVDDERDKNDANGDGNQDIYKNKDFDPDKPRTDADRNPRGDDGGGHTYREVYPPGTPNREEEQFNKPAPKANI